MPLPLTSLVRPVSPKLSLSSSATVAPTTSVVTVAREALAPSAPAPAPVVRVPLANAAIGPAPAPVSTTAAPAPVPDPVPDVRPPVSTFRGELAVSPAAPRTTAPAASSAALPMVARPAPAPAGGGGTAADPLDLLPGRGAPDAAAREALAPREPGPRRSDLLLVGVVLAAGGALWWWSRGLARS